MMKMALSAMMRQLMPTTPLEELIRGWFDRLGVSGCIHEVFIAVIRISNPGQSGA